MLIKDHCFSQDIVVASAPEIEEQLFNSQKSMRHLML